MENNEEILKKISSGDPEAIAEAVDTVKENGDLVIAGKLLDILSQPLAPSTITIIANLLADIKDNQFKDLLIQKLEQTSEGTLKKELLRDCLGIFIGLLFLFRSFFTNLAGGRFYCSFRSFHSD